MDRSAITVAQIMKKANYHTGHFGKWHLGPKPGMRPYERGFDLSIEASKLGKTQILGGTLSRNRVKEPYEQYRTDALFDESMKWIRSLKGDEKPFFCYLPTYNPHAPFVVPEKWVEPYKDLGLPDHGDIRGYRNWGAGFYGEIANIDWNIGRLIKFLKKEGLEENTLLMYMTDNGHAMSGALYTGMSERTGFVSKNGLYNMGMRGGKGLPWRGGTCVPWIWRWPGKIAANRSIDTLAGAIDFLPTMIDLAGGSFEHKIDGLSVLPVVEDPEATMPDRALFVHKTVMNSEQGL